MIVVAGVFFSYRHAYEVLTYAGLYITALILEY